MQNKINPYLVVIGTRPEAIKLAPLCIEMKKRKIKYKILLTGGYANFFKKKIKKKVVIDRDITIKGIANAYKELI